MIAFLLAVIAIILLFAHFPKLAKQLLQYSLWIAGILAVCAALFIGYLIIADNVSAKSLSGVAPIIGVVVGGAIIRAWQEGGMSARLKEWVVPENRLSNDRITRARKRYLLVFTGIALIAALILLATESYISAVLVGLLGGYLGLRWQVIQDTRLSAWALVHLPVLMIIDKNQPFALDKFDEEDESIESDLAFATFLYKLFTYDTLLNLKWGGSYYNCILQSQVRKMELDEVWFTNLARMREELMEWEAGEKSLWTLDGYMCMTQMAYNSKALKDMGEKERLKWLAEVGEPAFEKARLSVIQVWEKGPAGKLVTREAIDEWIKEEGLTEFLISSTEQAPEPRWNPDDTFSLAMKPIEDFNNKTSVLACKKSRKNDGFAGYSELFFWVFKCGLWNTFAKEALGDKGFEATLKYQIFMLKDLLKNNTVSEIYELMMEDFREEFSKEDAEYDIVSRILARWYARLITEEELSNENALKQINGELRERCKTSAGEIGKYWTSTYPTNVKVPAKEVDRWVKFVDSQLTPATASPAA